MSRSHEGEDASSKVYYMRIAVESNVLELKEWPRYGVFSERPS